MKDNLDSSLGQWLTRIKVKPFQPSKTVSPVINFLLSHYSFQECRAKLDNELPSSTGIEDVFLHCGVPNILLAHLNGENLIESLKVHGERLKAHPSQYSLLSKTSISSFIDYYDDEFSISGRIECIDKDDTEEFNSMRSNYAYLPRSNLSLRQDNGFMLYKSIADFLNEPVDEHYFSIAVNLKPFVNTSLIKLSNAFANRKTEKLPIDIEQLIKIAQTRSQIDIANYLSTICPIPFSLTPTRYALIASELGHSPGATETQC